MYDAAIRDDNLVDARSGFVEGIPEVAHIALTVQDLDQAITWYQTLMGGPPERVGRTGAFRYASWPIGRDTRIVLHEFSRASQPDRERPAPGLHHLSLKCADRAALEAWADRLSRAGIEHGGIRDQRNASTLAVEDPDGICFQFYLPAPGDDAAT